MNDPRILGPIPTPPAQRWREVRLLYLPRIVFALGVIAAVILWSRWVAPATLVAEAEVLHVDVRAAQPGVVAGLKVDLLQPVRAGEVIGHVAAANPRLLEASLDVIRAELGMLSATMAGATDMQRSTLEFEKMQVDWMSRRVDLASLQGRLQQAEADLARAEPLFKQGLVTEQNIAQLKTARDSLTAQVAEQSRLVTHLEPIVRSFSPKDEKDTGLSTQSALAAALKVQEAKLRVAEQQLAPLPLVAPLDGVVSQLLRRSGETVTAGEAIVRISATRSERITGFLRQPLTVQPAVGMTVQLRTRSAPRQVVDSKIVQVGSAMEPISPSLVSAMKLPANMVPEPGLRVNIAVPNGFKLRPGEMVDVVVR